MLVTSPRRVLAGQRADDDAGVQLQRRQLRRVQRTPRTLGRLRRPRGFRLALPSVVDCQLLLAVTGRRDRLVGRSKKKVEYKNRTHFHALTQ